MLLVTEHHPSKSISSSTNKSAGDTQHKGTTNTSNTDIGTILSTSVISSKSALRLILPPLSRAHEQLRGPQLVKKCPTFYGTRRFISADGHSLLVFILIQMAPVHDLSSYFFMFHFNIILLYVPRHSKWPISFRLPHPASNSLLSHTCHIPCPSHHS